MLQNYNIQYYNFATQAALLAIPLLLRLCVAGLVAWIADRGIDGGIWWEWFQGPISVYIYIIYTYDWDTYNIYIYIYQIMGCLLIYGDIV